MKRFGKFFALVVAIFGLTMNASATNKWDVTRSEYKKTSDGITASFDRKDRYNAVLTYTISEEYNERTIYLNIVDDLRTLLGGTYMPGSDAYFIIKIVNNSKFDFKYTDNSLTIDTLNWNEVFNEDYAIYGEDVYYPSNVGDLLERQYIKGAKAFDGSVLEYTYSIDRTANSAIQALYKNSKNYVSGKYNYDGKSYNVGSYLDKVLMSDNVLGEELIAQGYTNGIEDLDKYYLNYYNNVYNLNAETLYDLTDNAVNYGLFGGNNSHHIPETNSAVSSFGYDWFYNKGLSISPVKDVDGNSISRDLLDNGNFFIGSYMRGENDVLEKVFRKDFAEISTTSELTQLDLNMSGPNVGNAHALYNYGFMLAFKLEITNYGTLKVNYVDTDGNKLADTVEKIGVAGTKYNTEKKEFENYEFLKVDGEETGEYVLGETIEVTYVYTNAIGTVDPIEPVNPDAQPEEPKPIEPPHTGVEVVNVTTNNIIMYIEDKKRK